MAEDREVYSWDDEVDEAEYTLLPPGDYKFTVKGFEKGYYEPKDPSKGPACDQANLQLSVHGTDTKGNEVDAVIFHSLRLRKKEIGFTRIFFDCIGLVPKTGKAPLPWNKIAGETGICEIEIHEYNGQESNRVKKFYEKAKAPTTGKNFGTGASTGYTEPSFAL